MIGDLLNFGAKLIGGFMGQNAQENANAANQALAQTQMAYQHEANTHGVRWRVADAIAAGLHPLAALGMSPASGVSASVGRQEPETAMADAVGSMGQDISRAINATRTNDERIAAHNNKVRALTLERAELQNQYLRARIQREQQERNPPMPGDTGQVDVSPAPDTSRSALNPALQAGSIPSVDFEEVAPGKYAPVPSKLSKERQEDDFIAETMWKFRHLLMPTFSSDWRQPPSHIKLKEGHQWHWHPTGLYWTQKPTSGEARWHFGR